jgi:transposase-like protein
MERIEILFIKDVARELGVCKKTVNNWLKYQDEGHFFKLGGRYAIMREDLQDFVKSKIQ